jgi:hypothetical protein
MYNLLPFMEFKTIHDMGKTGGTAMTPATPQKKDMLARMCEIPLSAFNCPTRRKVVAYTISPTWSEGDASVHPNASGCTTFARSDYAGCAGSGGTYYNVGPDSYSTIATWSWIPDNLFNGVIFQRSAIKQTDVIDGMSHTFLCGEKYLNPDSYFDGTDPGDSGPMFQGYDWDIVRLANATWVPYRDRRGFGIWGWYFGSAHPASFNMACCDGSVHALSYDIDPPTYAKLGGRNDKGLIDSSKVTW